MADGPRREEAAQGGSVGVENSDGGHVNSDGGHGAAPNGVELPESVNADVRMVDAPAVIERDGSVGADEEPFGKGEAAVRLAQGESNRDGAEEEDTTGHIPVFVGNLGDAFDE